MQTNVGRTASHNIQTALNQRSSHLLRLPAELRLRIYDYALSEDTQVVLLSDEGVKTGQPALLRTCRQIRNEALDLYYSSNIFVLVLNVNGRKAMETETAWTATQPARCQLVKKFIIEICCMNWRASEALYLVDKACNFLFSDLRDCDVASDKILFTLAEDHRQQIKEGVRVGSGYYHELAGHNVHPRVIKREVETECALVEYLVAFWNSERLGGSVRDYL
ncbi:hypothetical protein LTR37_007643 [Vermiconidia calcicola]|uniref:Uncharacterized protein n=1 Tax=Vermiconidia calcicola TaxID=1690605 RepID=A0ACC3NEA7_9PEZI|nr:hypothetical protein LTR37_007643 [Vermiconidia calcicola]